MTLMCASPRCRLPGRHRDDCDDEQCRGCAPTRAADGLRLCPHCTDRIGRDAIETARLWYEIGLALTAAGANGTPVRNPHPGIAISPRAIETRAEIRRTLASWCRLVAEERGHALPRDESQHALGAYIARNAQWLSATDYADEAADELAGLRGRAWAAAYPEGVSVVDIGSCPHAAGDGLCPGVVKAILRHEASLLPSKIACSADSTHEWTTERWRALGRALGKLWDMHARPDVVAVAYGIEIAEVYRTAHKAEWRTVREGRRVLYDTRDVVATMGA
jgi:hypothetical protein